MPKVGDTGTADGKPFVWKKNANSNVLTRDFTKRGIEAAKKKSASATTKKKTATPVRKTANPVKKTATSTGGGSNPPKSVRPRLRPGGDNKGGTKSGGPDKIIRPKLRPEGGKKDGTKSGGPLTSSLRPKLRPEGGKTDGTKSDGPLTSSLRPRLRPGDTKKVTNGVRPAGGKGGLPAAKRAATNGVRPTRGTTGLQGARKTAGGKVKASGPGNYSNANKRVSPPQNTVSNLSKPSTSNTGAGKRDSARKTDTSPSRKSPNKPGANTDRSGRDGRQRDSALPADIMRVDPAKFLPERLVKAAKRGGKNLSMKDLYAALSKKITNEDIMRAYRRYAGRRKDSIAKARN